MSAAIRSTMRSTPMKAHYEHRDPTSANGTVMRFRGLIAAFFFAAISLSIGAVGGDTIAEYLVAACPNGQALKRAVNALDEAKALNDSGIPKLDREVARQYYRCAHVTDDGYAHDWARLLYFVFLAASLRTDADRGDYAQTILSGIYELAVTSKYADVRAVAKDQYSTDRVFLPPLPSP